MRRHPQPDTLGLEHRAAERQPHRPQSGAATAHRSHDPLGVAGADLVGEADRLHGQMQPHDRHEVQAPQVGQAGLVATDHPAQVRQSTGDGLLAEGQVPGVLPPSGSPAGPPPPVAPHRGPPGRLLRSAPGQLASIIEEDGCEHRCSGESPPARNDRAGRRHLSGHDRARPADQLGVGGAYGLLRSRLPAPLRPRAAAAGLGLMAMAASDLPATALGVTDARTWGVAGRAG